ncbi:unnamed protein product [Urochloa humidicola]
MAGRCLNCQSYKHRVAQCHLPTRCFCCHGFRHLARDCKRPRSPESSASPKPADARRFLRPRRDSPPTPRGRAACGRTPTPLHRRPWIFAAVTTLVGAPLRRP